MARHGLLMIQAIDKKLAEIRQKNGGMPPNIVYILLDDVGFGEVGMDEISVIRGYKTPNISAFAKRRPQPAAYVYRTVLYANPCGHDDRPLSNPYRIN